MAVEDSQREGMEAKKKAKDSRIVVTCSNVTKYVSKSPEPASGKNGV